MVRLGLFRGSTSTPYYHNASVAGAASPTVGTDLRLGKASGKTPQIPFLRESSYVKEFDDYFKNVLIPRYQQDTGIKLVYEIVAAGGSAVARLVFIVGSKAPVGAG